MLFSHCYAFEGLLMNKILLISLLFSSLCADRVKEMSIACPDMQELLNIPQETQKDYVKLNQYAIAKNCVFTMPGDTVEVIDYEHGERSQLVKIQKNAHILYMRRDVIAIEQPGKKNSFKF